MDDPIELDRLGLTYSALLSRVKRGWTAEDVATWRDHRTGEKKSPEYTAWVCAKGRCYNPGNERYADYGGRGIRMSDEWRQDYLAFLRDMGRKPSPTHSLDRIDVDGNYEPGNCRWATPSEQARNTRRAKAARARELAGKG